MAAMFQDLSKPVTTRCLSSLKVSKSAGYYRPLGFEHLESRWLLSPAPRLIDINGIGIGSYPAALTDLNGSVYFAVNDQISGDELWRSDGTEAGTQLVIARTSDSLCPCIDDDCQSP
jgi:ELWxxDGT repeat protein